MPSITTSRARRPSLLALIGAGMMVALWVLGVILLCVPLFLISVILQKLSNWSLRGGYRVRDGLEWLGNKTEAATR